MEKVELTIKIFKNKKGILFIERDGCYIGISPKDLAMSNIYSFFEVELEFGLKNLKP